MATNSIAAELLQQINLTKLGPNPSYLSATDAISVDEFEQTVRPGVHPGHFEHSVGKCSK